MASECTLLADNNNCIEQEPGFTKKSTTAIVVSLHTKAN